MIVNKMNRRTAGSVSIFDALTVSGPKGYRDDRRKWPESSCGSMRNMLYKRTHTCGELTVDDVGKPVVLNGWVDAYRDFGGLVFIDLRDRYGVTQVVFEPDAGKELQARGQRAAQRIRRRRQGNGRSAAAPARRTPSSRRAGSRSASRSWSSTTPRRRLLSRCTGPSPTKSSG